MSKSYRAERGYVMILVMAISAISALLLYRELDTSSSATKVVLASKNRLENTYAAESAFNEAVTWLRSNSTGMAMQFSRSNYYTNFDRSAAPAIGVNDPHTVGVPSRVKNGGSNNTILLSNSAALGTSSFPAGVDTVTGVATNPLASFNAANFGTQLVRIALVDGVPVETALDFGDSPSPAPQTDFNPVYRVDVMNSANSGAHLFGYVLGSLVSDYGMGFYGRDSLEFRQNCDSYVSNNGAYSNATRRANCSAGSGGNAGVTLSSTIYGSLETTGAITAVPPFGGNICADFVASCPNEGQTCEGATCTVPGLPSYSTWATYCPTNQGNRTINANTSLSVPGNNPNQKCWSNVTVNSNRLLTLTSTDYPYFIDTLDIANNSVIAFNPSPGTGVINLYVRRFVGDRFNGNQVFNSNNKPYQLRIHYLGTNPLTLNGNATMNAFVVAPYAPITVSGNFTFQGGIKATALTATGAGVLRYDESGDITTISDVTYRPKNIEQYYR